MVRIAGIAGILAAAAGLVAAFFPLQGQFPNVSSTPAAVAAFYTTNHDNLFPASAVIPLIFGALIPFAAGQYAILRPLEGPGSAWSLVGAIGIAGASALFTVYGAAQIGLAYAATGPLQGQEGILAAIAYTNTVLSAFASVFLALFLAGFGAAAWRTRAAPRWSAAIALIGGALALTGISGAFTSGPLNDVGFIGGSVGMVLWVLVESVRMVRSSVSEAAVPVAHTAAAR